MHHLKGWNIPNDIILLGPFRSWIYPKIFRSDKVKNATLIKTIIIKINKLINTQIIIY